MLLTSWMLQPALQDSHRSRLAMLPAPSQRHVQDHRVRSRRCLERQFAQGPKYPVSSLLSGDHHGVDFLVLDRSIRSLNILERHPELFCCVRNTAVCRVRDAPGSLVTWSPNPSSPCTFTITPALSRSWKSVASSTHARLPFDRDTDTESPHHLLY